MIAFNGHIFWGCVAPGHIFAANSFSRGVHFWDAEEESDSYIILVMVDSYLHFDSVLCTWVRSDEPLLVPRWT